MYATRYTPSGDRGPAFGQARHALCRGTPESWTFLSDVGPFSLSVCSTVHNQKVEPFWPKVGALSLGSIYAEHLEGIQLQGPAALKGKQT